MIPRRCVVCGSQAGLASSWLVRDNDIVVLRDINDLGLGLTIMENQMATNMENYMEIAFPLMT